MWQFRPGLLGGIDGGKASAADASETTAFLARTSGLDATHTNAYKALINGLVADGIFTGVLDALHILFTQDATTAALNLVQDAYNLTLSGTPTFTADNGYQTGNSAHYIETGFNPTSASSPNFVQNSNCQFVWQMLNAADGNCFCGNGNSHIFPRFNGDNLFYGRATCTGAAGVSVASPVGFFSANRSASNAWQTYYNGSAATSGSDASAAPTNATFQLLRLNGASSATAQQAGVYGYGKSLSSGNQTSLYNRIRTFATAVGVP